MWSLAILFAVLAIARLFTANQWGPFDLSPERWARIPQLLRFAPRVQVGIAWSNSRSSIWMRRVLGVMYFVFGACVHFALASVLLKH